MVQPCTNGNDKMQYVNLACWRNASFSCSNQFCGISWR